MRFDVLKLFSHFEIPSSLNSHSFFSEGSTQLNLFITSAKMVLKLYSQGELSVRFTESGFIQLRENLEKGTFLKKKIMENLETQRIF